MADITQINAIIEQSPNTLGMPVLEFIRIHHTDDNRLGEDSVIQLLSALFNGGEVEDKYITQLSIQQAVRITVSAADALKQRAEGPLDISKELI